MRCLPASKAMAQKIIMPLGYFYSPFIADARVVHMQPSLCSKCKASVNSMSERNRKEKTWNCLFCGNNNPYLSELGTAQVEEYL